MLQHTDEKKPTGSTNYPAGHTDGVIVSDASSAVEFEKPLLALGKDSLKVYAADRQRRGKTRQVEPVG